MCKLIFGGMTKANVGGTGFLSISHAGSILSCWRNEKLVIWYRVSVTGRKSSNVYKKLPQNDLTRKMKDFDTFK